jgi:hypothetical protein
MRLGPQEWRFINEKNSALQSIKLRYQGYAIFHDNVEVGFVGHRFHKWYALPLNDTNLHAFRSRKEAIESLLCF